eukprot:818625-Lingulodinium_polyedra.AAC.1
MPELAAPCVSQTWSPCILQAPMAAQFSSAHAARPWLRPAAAAPFSASSMLTLVCSPRRAQTTRSIASM